MIMKKQQGFTLLELSIIVIVLVILAVLIFGTH
jgi:Tfp pilus assembly protein PilE